MKNDTPLFGHHEKVMFVAALVLGLSFISMQLVSVALAPRVSVAQAVPPDDAVYTNWVRPQAQGSYSEWTPTPPDAGNAHFFLVSEAVCDKNNTYVATRVIGKTELYAVSLAGVPNGATINDIEVDLCASNDGVDAAKPAGMLAALYRFSGGPIAEGKEAEVMGTEPGKFALATWSNLKLVKTAGSTFEVGMRLTGGTLGARVSRVAVRVRYTPNIIAPPTSLHADNLNGTTTVVWQDNADNEQGYSVEFSSTTLSGPWRELARTGTNIRSYQHRNIPRDRTWHYRVRAYNAYGYSSYSNTDAAVYATVLPANPNNISAAFSEDGQVTVTWNDNSNNEETFTIQLITENNVVRQAFIVEGDTTLWVHQNAPTDELMYYRVGATNARGSSQFFSSPWIIRYTRVPGMPNNFNVAVTSTNPYLSWTRSTSNTQGYALERRTADQNFVEITRLGNSQIAAYSDRNLSSGTYFYRMRAYNPLGESAYTETLIGQVP